MRRLASIAAAVFLAAASCFAIAQHDHSEMPVPTTSTRPSTAPAATITLIQTKGDRGEQVIQATVTVGDKALANAKVAFYVKRTFGNMLLGQDTTLDDGTAQVPFPTGLPASQDGQLHVIAAITEPARYSAAKGTADFPGAIFRHDAEPYPRALWAPQAPITLIAAIFAILGMVWFAYGYVIAQLVRLART